MSMHFLILPGLRRLWMTPVTIENKAIGELLGCAPKRVRLN